ncbi:hypothetical protein [Erysiphe lesion-associated ormycovirus 3]|nr:hypothetical protein [Erysiphe lesion-associated ormycovirus 3]
MTDEIKNIESDLDMLQFAKSFIKTQLIIKDKDILLDFTKDLATKLSLMKISDGVESHERLVKALDTGPSNHETVKKPYLVVSGNVLVFRIPSYDTKNTGQEDNLGKIMKWAVTLLNVKNPRVRMVRDKNLGNDIVLPARVSRMMDMTISALTLPPSEAGERSEFKIGFKANLVELLAAIKLLKKNIGLVQKAPTPKRTKSLTISLDDLKKSVNGRAGLNEHGMPGYLVGIVKEVFNILTKPNTNILPGNWINSLKQTNGVQSSTAVLYKLGYETIVASPQKTLTVVKHRVRDREPKNSSEIKQSVSRTVDGKQQKIFSEVYVTDDKNEPTGISHQEFRLGVCMLLPYIDPSSSLDMKSQISKDPLSVRNRAVLEFYKRNRRIVDLSNMTYATRSALGKKDSKATVRGYQNARYRTFNECIKCDFMDAHGNTYARFSDIPKDIRGFLCKLMNRKLNASETEPLDDTEGGEPIPLDEDVEMEPSTAPDEEVELQAPTRRTRKSKRPEKHTSQVDDMDVFPKRDKVLKSK